jgi:hypothetical protein
LETVRNIFEEDETKDDVFIFGSIKVAASFVGSGPKRLFEVVVGHVRSYCGVNWQFAPHAKR